MLTKLIYASMAARPITNEDLAAILEISRDWNGKNNITGMLCFGNNRFLQILEGNRVLIDDLFTRILKDKRHHNIKLLDYGQTKEHLYKNWSMGYIDATDKTVTAAIEKITGTPELIGENLTHNQAYALVSALHHRISTPFPNTPL